LKTNHWNEESPQTIHHRFADNRANRFGGYRHHPGRKADKQASAAGCIYSPCGNALREQHPKHP
jgi:hypothetical protein